MTGRPCAVNPFERQNWSRTLYVVDRETVISRTDPSRLPPDQFRIYRELVEKLGNSEARRIMFGGQG